MGTIQVTDKDVTIEVISGSLQLKSLTIGNKKIKLKHFDLKEGNKQTIKQQNYG